MGAVAASTHPDLMMQPEQINHAADKLRSDYRLFNMALTGIFGRALDQGDPTTSRARTTVKTAISSLSEGFMDSAVSSACAALSEVASVAVAQSGVEVSGETRASITEHVNWLSECLWDRVRECVMRDGLTTEQALRRLALNVDIASMRGSVGKTTAIIGARYGAVRNLSHVQQDRLGRKLSSDTFVRLVVREALMNAYVETFLFAQASAGFDVAEAVKSDGEHIVFSITGNTPGMSSYDEIRDAVFHPQSRAFLLPVKDR